MTISSASTDTFPRQNARTLRYTLGRPRSFSVSEDGRTVLYVRSAGGSDRVGRLWCWTAEDGEVLLADPNALLAGTDEELSPEEKSRRERAREAAGGVVGYSVDDAFENVAFALSGRLFVTQVKGSGTSEISVDGSVIDPRIDPTGQRVAFVASGALHVAEIAEGSTRQLSPAETSETVSWGMADFIAAEELERTRGFWWSPDGQTLLTQRTDEAPVQVWYVANPANPEVAPTPQRYPSAGTANADVSLWLIRLDGSRTEVRLSEESEYVASVHWPSSYSPVVSVLDRSQRLMRFLDVDVTSGATTVVREVRDDCWVDVKPGAGNRDPKGRLLTIEVADGDYALLADGERLTPAGLQVRGVVTGGADLLVAASESAADSEVWRVADDAVERLSPAGGWHVGVPGGTTTVIVSADLDHPLPVSTITSPTSTFEIPSYAEEPLIEPRVNLLPGDDDRPRIAVLFPEGWEPGSAQLPVLLDPYGGPHFASVMRFQGAFRESQWFANQGFAVVVVDGRGTPGTPAWERAVHGDFAGPVLEDQVQGLHAASHAFPDLNLDKVAMRGWSFGGYLSAMAVIDRPDVFHAAVAGAPVTDQRLYDTGYTERYLGLPQTSPESYDKSSLLERAKNLSRPLQLIHGFADDNVFVAHTMKLSQVLTEHGRSHEVIPLTGITHMATQEEVAENLLLLQVDFLRRALDL